MNELPPELPSNEELQNSLKRLDRLEERVEKNGQRSKNAWAASVLAGFGLLAVLFSGEVNFGEKFTLNIKTRDIDTGDLVSIGGFGLLAVGAITWEELLGLLNRPKN